MPWLSRSFDWIARWFEGTPRVEHRNTAYRYFVRSTDGFDKESGTEWFHPVTFRKVDYATWRAAWVVDEDDEVVVYVAMWDVTARTVISSTRKALRQRGFVLDIDHLPPAIVPV